MKIAKITLQNFRAFDEPFELDMDEGKSLLLHGENGSGKSSIYLALKRFFEERGDDISRYRNQFASDMRNPHIRVRIRGKDATGAVRDESFEWNGSDGHPLPVPQDATTSKISKENRSLLIDAARRAGFLDYRGMLRTHLLSNPLSRSNRGPNVHDVIYGADSVGLESQLFDLVSLVVLAGVRTTTASGNYATIGSLIRSVWENRPLARYKYMIDEANRYASAFNQAFNAVLPELEKRLAHFLGYFANHQLGITFQPVALTWDKPSLELKGAELAPVVKFREKAILNYDKFLNEARLSALATCLFLAGVHLSDNDYANAGYPRFLVLDDALIGLELQNRLPILRILKSSAFRNYQIFLFTHDRVWFDLARACLTEKEGWLHKDLIADETSGKLIPRNKPSVSDLEKARTHLQNGDLPAAAVHARSAFEAKLKNVCEDRGIFLKYKKESKHVSAEDLWQGICSRQRKREELRKTNPLVSDFIPAQLEQDVETIRSIVLNQLSHAGATSLVAADVENAISIVDTFHKHHFTNL